jgi:hypothetical protein
MTRTLSKSAVRCRLHCSTASAIKCCFGLMAHSFASHTTRTWSCLVNCTKSSRKFWSQNKGSGSNREEGGAHHPNLERMIYSPLSRWRASSPRTQVVIHLRWGVKCCHSALPLFSEPTEMLRMNTIGVRKTAAPVSVLVGSVVHLRHDRHHLRYHAAILRSYFRRYRYRGIFPTSYGDFPRAKYWLARTSGALPSNTNTTSYNNRRD